MNVPITKETIALYTDLLKYPQKYNCDYKPLNECFCIAETYTPQDELYEQYVAYINKPLPKAVFYIIMRNTYSLLFSAERVVIDGKVERGNLGFKLQFNKHLL